MPIDLEVANNTEVVTENQVGISSTTNVDVCVEDARDLDITVNRREFSVVGDDVFIPKYYDDAPQWMKDLIQTVIDITAEGIDTKVKADLVAALSEFATSYVPMNQYTESIINTKLGLDGRLNGIVSTLNTTIDEAKATAIAEALTEATSLYAKSSEVNTLAAEFQDNVAVVGTLQTALADETSARSGQYTVLTSTIEDVDAATTSNATVTEYLTNYVGLDEAGASSGTGLSAYLEGSDGTIGGADSEVANAVYIDNGVPKSKWEYGSIINVGGVNYTNGFGIKAEGAESEFWVDASRLKFTNSDVTGQVSPFTIDATGVTPQVQFNGVVAFSNVTGYTPPDVSGDINANNKVFAKKMGYANYAEMVSAAKANNTIIDRGHINTDLIEADKLVISTSNTDGSVTVDSSGVSVYVNGVERVKLGLLS